MIIKIIQGPGNQIFQYAYALAASKRIGAELKLDLDWYRHYSGHRPYVLDRFNITAPVASAEEIQYVKSKNGPNFIQYRWNLIRDKLAPTNKKAVVVEDITHVDLSLKYPYRHAYIEGYFTSEEFFSDFSDDVKRELSFVGDLGERSAEVMSQMKESESVALSLRRGDFVGKEWQNVCTFEYYHRAIEQMEQMIESPVYFIFSDEVEWVKRNFKLNGKVVFMDFNHPNYMEDMRLMTYCKHHIIANSTFSWWGAWLSGSSNILCPVHWLNPNIETHRKEFNGKWVDFSHVLPKAWKRIPNLAEGDTLIT